jgi:hypothetical protein
MIKTCPQIKRERALEEAKRQERAAKIKEENRIRRGIILAVRNQAGAGMTYGGSAGGGGSTSRSSAAASDAGSRADAAPSVRESTSAGAGRGVEDDGGFFVTQPPGE